MIRRWAHVVLAFVVGVAGLIWFRAEMDQQARERAQDRADRAALVQQVIQLGGKPVVEAKPGDRGAAGPQGPQGERGPRGPAGPIGPVGPQGLPGTIGVRGPIGLPGQNGTDGADGTDGVDGSPGKDGVDGEPGPPGVAGKDGQDGADGAKGDPGRGVTNVECTSDRPVTFTITYSDGTTETVTCGGPTATPTPAIRLGKAG